MTRRALATTFLAQSRRAQSLYCAASSTIDDTHVPRRNKAIAPYLCRVASRSFTSQVATVSARCGAVTSCCSPDHDDVTPWDSLGRCRRDTLANPPVGEQGAATD